MTGFAIALMLLGLLVGYNAPTIADFLVGTLGQTLAMVVVVAAWVPATWFACKYLVGGFSGGR